MIRCCKCNKKYSFVPYEDIKGLLVIVCPHCGFRHSVDFKPIEESQITKEGYLVTITSEWATIWDISSGEKISKLGDREFYCVEEPYNKISLLITWSKQKGLKEENFKRKGRY